MIDINYYASNKLRQLRISKGLTQQQLADKIHVSQQQIARLEANQRKFKQDILYKLAEFFNVSVDSFTPYDENMDNIEILYRENKDKLTPDDLQMIQFIIEKRKDNK